MSTALRPERVTQNRVVARLTAPASAGGLGYAHLGDWSQREGSRGIETELVRIPARGEDSGHPFKRDTLQADGQTGCPPLDAENHQGRAMQ